MRYEFDEFVLDLNLAELRRGDTVLHLEPKSFDLLQFLVQNPDRVVQKGEIFDQIWPGVFVTDASLSVAIKQIRQALGNDGKSQKFIKTLRGKGFRFVGELSRPAHSTSGAAPDALLRSGQSDMPSIAVMPFDNLGDASDEAYFADGIGDEVTFALGRMPWLFVISRNSTMSYKGKTFDIRQVADELGVRYILTGNVRKSGDRVRVSVQLLDGQSAEQLWTARHDADLQDVFAVQDDITDRIVGALEPQVGMAEIDRSMQKVGQDLDAWDLVLRAMALKSTCTQDDSLQAVALLERAIEIAPNYARAHGLLGWILVWRLHQGWGEPESDAARAIAAPRRALEINPSFAMGHSWMGAALAVTGNGADAFQWIEKARSLSPRDIFKEEFDLHESFAHFQCRDYEAAYILAHRAMVAQPQHVYAHLIMAASLGHQNLPTAQDRISRIQELVPGATVETFLPSCVFIPEAERDHFLDGLAQAGLKRAP